MKRKLARKPIASENGKKLVKLRKKRNASV
jgi:hypothetical protein